MTTSCLSPAESGLHWYWALAESKQRRRDNVTAESLAMLTDDGVLTLWFQEVAGSGVWCRLTWDLECTDHCSAALQSTVVKFLQLSIIFFYILNLGHV